MSYDSLRSQCAKGANRSKYFEMLKADEQSKVLEWVQMLQSENKLTNNTINSYKSYVCKALATVQSGAKLTNDQKSAVRLFLDMMDK